MKDLGIQIYQANDKLWVTSLEVAKCFNRRHSNILRSIRAIIQESDKEVSKYYQKTEYTASRNRKFPIFNMNKQGFILLVMGLVGREAMQWKKEFIKTCDINIPNIKYLNAACKRNPLNILYILRNTIGNDTYIKIGICKDLAIRIKSLQVGNPNPFEVIKTYYLHNTHYVETILHHRLIANRAESEWFRWNESIIETIHQIVSEHGQFSPIPKPVNDSNIEGSLQYELDI